MQRLGVLVLLCAIERVAIAGPGWSITWPAEWTDATQEALKKPDMQAMLKQLARLHAMTDVAVRADAEGHVAQVLYTELPLDTSTAAGVRDFVDGARNATRKAAREISYSQREARKHSGRRTDAGARRARADAWRPGGLQCLAGAVRDRARIAGARSD